jgi:hypothetical protein
MTRNPSSTMKIRSANTFLHAFDMTPNFYFSNSFLIAKCIWEQQRNLCHHDQMITVQTRDSSGTQQVSGPYGNEASDIVLHSAGELAL